MRAAVSALAEALESYCAPWAAADARFWTVPPAYHVEELLFSTIVAVVAGIAARILGSFGKKRTTTIKPVVAKISKAEASLGRFLQIMFALNFINKQFVQSMPLERTLLELALLPCHVFTAMCIFCLLGTSHAARSTTYSLLLYCAWMPAMALAFPDLNSARALSTKVLRYGSLGLFFGHHITLLLTPVYLHRLATSKAKRFSPPTPPGLGLLQYLSFIYTFIGVVLCAAALLTGRNLNYSLWPPNVPAQVHLLLGGARYRATVGLILAFVAGPLMRHAVVPLASGFVLPWVYSQGVARKSGSVDRTTRKKTKVS